MTSKLNLELNINNTRAKIIEGKAVLVTDDPDWLTYTVYDLSHGKRTYAGCYPEALCDALDRLLCDFCTLDVTCKTSDGNFTVTLPNGRQASVYNMDGWHLFMSIDGEPETLDIQQIVYGKADHASMTCMKLRSAAWPTAYVR